MICVQAFATANAKRSTFTKHIVPRRGQMSFILDNVPSFRDSVMNFKLLNSTAF